MSKETEKEKQLDFGFKNPIRNVISKYFHKVSLRLTLLETKQFLSSPLTWLLLLSTLALIGYQVYLIYNVYNILPSEVPLTLYVLDLSKRLMEKQYIYAIPGVSAVVMVISSRIAYIYFNKSREMSFFVLFSGLLSALLLTLSLLRLVAPFYA